MQSQYILLSMASAYSTLLSKRRTCEPAISVTRMVIAVLATLRLPRRTPQGIHTRSSSQNFWCHQSHIISHLEIFRFFGPTPHSIPHDSNFGYTQKNVSLPLISSPKLHPLYAFHQCIISAAFISKYNIYIYRCVCVTYMCMCIYLWHNACPPSGFGCYTSSIMFHRLRMQMNIAKLYLVVLEE